MTCNSGLHDLQHVQYGGGKDYKESENEGESHALSLFKVILQRGSGINMASHLYVYWAVVSNLCLCPNLCNLSQALSEKSHMELVNY